MNKAKCHIEANEAIIARYIEQRNEIKVAIDKLKNKNAELEKSAHRLYKGQPVIGIIGISSVMKGLYAGIDNANSLYRYKIDIGSGPIVGVKKCKPDLDFKSITNWIEWNGGDCPVDGGEMVVVERRNGTTDYGIASSFIWIHGNVVSGIVTYAVIALPEFIE